MRRSIRSGLAALGTTAVASGMLGGFAGTASAAVSGTTNVISVAPQTPVGDTNPDAGGGFWSSAGAPTASAPVGATVQVLVTSIQTNPDPFTSSGVFSVSYDPAELSFQGDSADPAGSCTTTQGGAGEATVASCPEGGVENAAAPYGKSDSFFFTVVGTAGAVDEATATVQIGDTATSTTTASRTFYLDVPEATSLSAAPYVATLGPSLHLELKASAVLTAGGAPVANEPVSFLTGSGTLCQTSTDSSGVASCTGNAADAVLNDGYTAKFAGTDVLEPSSASARLLSIAGIGL